MNHIASDSLSTKSNCRVCGGVIKQKSNGRTKEYCSTHCSNYSKYLNALERSIDSIRFQDYKYIKQIRSKLFQMVNSLPKQVEKV